MSWKCEQCGKCCRFIVIPVRENIDIETKDYLEAHGIAIDGKKLIIPALCKYLQQIHDYDKSKGKEMYKCTIHTDKYVNCRLGGKKECENAKKDYETLKNL